MDAASIYTNPKAFVIDVRGPDEVAAGTLQRAVNIVHTDISRAASKLPSSKDTPILVFCKSGNRAGMAMTTLQGMGYRNILNGGGYTGLKYLDQLPQATTTAAVSLDPTAVYTNSKSFVIDVRDPDEVAEGTLKRAVNIPYRNIGQSTKLLPTDKNTPILLFCLSGGRASAALDTLKAMGYTTVVNGGGYSRLKHLDGLLKAQDKAETPLSELELEAMKELQHLEDSKEVLQQLCPRTKFPVRYWVEGQSTDVQKYFDGIPSLVDDSLNALADKMPAGPRMHLIEALLGPGATAITTEEAARLRALLYARVSG